MTPPAARELLARWRAAGWLRALDLAFADFLHGLDPAAPGSLLAAAALLAHLEGQGHSCLPLEEFGRDPQALLDWPAEAASDLDALRAQWPSDAAAAQAAWAGTGVLQSLARDGDGDGEREGDDGSSPLVLCDGRLSLRRYWRYESLVAAQVRMRCVVGDGVAADAATATATVLDKARARALLDQIFGAAPAAPAENGPRAPDWQKIACALALRGRLTLITGGPGTGKTYTAARLLLLLQALQAGRPPLRVALAAPTGKAATRLRQSIEAALQALRGSGQAVLLAQDGAAPLGPARTLHALLGARPGTRRLRHDAAHPLEVDLLVVDEASMIHLEMMAALLAALPATARLVLLGDPDQLASVEAGAVLGDLCRGAGPQAYGAATLRWLRDLSGEDLPAGGAPADAAANTPANTPADAAAGNPLAQQTVSLRRSRRFTGPISELAAAIKRGDGAAVMAVLQRQPAAEVALVQTPDPLAVAALALAGRASAGPQAGPPGATPASGGYRTYLEALARGPADAAGFEAWARQVLASFDDFRVLCVLREGPWGVAGQNAAIERALAAAGLLARRGEWYEGRPVMVTRNDPALGIFNGDIGLVLRPPGAAALRAYFLDGEGLRSVAVTRLAAVETAFAMTVHKSQGSEFAHVVLVLPDADSALLTRELVYTGVTRARRALTVVASDARQLALASGRLTRRLSGLQALLREGGGGGAAKTS